MAPVTPAPTRTPEPGRTGACGTSGRAGDTAALLPGAAGAADAGARTQEVSKSWTEWIAVAVEAVAVLIIALASAEAAVRAVVVYVSRPAMPDTAKEGVRPRLARWLAVALGFASAADILRTAISPSWKDTGNLAAIATLRTLLNYFLQKEIEAAARTTGRGRRCGRRAEVLAAVAHVVAALIEAACSLLLVGFALAACGALARGDGPERAKLLVVAGAILALSFKTGAAPLNALDLPNWERIAAFVAMLDSRCARR